MFGAGCGVVPGYVFLPDAEYRLRSGDRHRMRLFCRRFAPDICVALNNGSRTDLSDSGVTGALKVRRLTHDGRLTSVRVA